MSKRINLDFFNRNTLEVAEDLIGKIIVRKYKDELLKIRITETEGYLGEKDKASHTYNGKITERTKIMFGPYGKTYIYLIYGMYYCLNFVTEEEGVGSAVLIRSGDVIQGLDTISILRYNKKYKDLNNYQRKNISNGPGKLSIALNLSKENNDKFLNSKDLYLEDDGYRDFEVGRGKRVNIDYAEEAKDFLWRFYLKE